MRDARRTSLGAGQLSSPLVLISRPSTIVPASRAPRTSTPQSVARSWSCSGDDDVDKATECPYRQCGGLQHPALPAGKARSRAVSRPGRPLPASQPSRPGVERHLKSKAKRE